MSKLDARVIARMAKDRNRRDALDAAFRWAETQKRIERQVRAKYEPVFNRLRDYSQPEPKKWWQW